MLILLQILLSNLAIILIAFLSKEFIFKKLTDLPKVILNGLNIILYSFLIICLFYIPVQIDEFRFDLRVVILLFLAITYGWRITVPVLITTVIWRYSIIGGSAAIDSIIYNMIVPVLIGLYFYQGRKILPLLKQFILATSIWLVTLLPLTWIVPNGFEMLKTIAIVHYLAFVFCFLILYGLYATTIKHEQMEEKVRHMAYHDALTGLPNRYMLINEVEKSITRCKQNNKDLAVLFLDLDRFKFINDSTGHLAGDILLKQVAERLLRVEDIDVVSRQGGDEFILLLEDIDPSKLKVIVDEILIQFTKPFILNEEDHFSISTSIGISLLSSDGEDREVLIKNADVAMYSAKKSGKNTYQFFSHIDDNLESRLKADGR